ncbi:hypothetical protein DXG03_009158 [Asterophora parasitica]|uniref:Ricin B lectin domain-containing protein n=1 Tax=Asterophora parasitica TaxID=117018 RepID=A0A9P7KB28_9AGAR|nr:hypothetical protein DXG03_009158 [Asterophora parasitica]
MSIQNGRAYVLVNVKSGTVLDLSGTDGQSMLQWILENNNNQWTFKNAGTGKFLGVAPGNVENGHSVLASDSPVAWDIWPDDVDSSVYRIFVHGTKFNVDLSDHGNANNGTPVTLWGKWKGTNQTWRFVDGEILVI